jgi:type 1 fimbriae regulatory protein FimB
VNDRKRVTAHEFEKLMAATKGSRHEARDRCLLPLMSRHGLRVSEACALQLDEVDIESRVLHVTRLKKGLFTTHPLRPDEQRVIKAWLAYRASMKPTGKAFFMSQHHKPLNRRTAWIAVRKYGELAGLELPAHPHQLRHACGFALANQGADTRLIQDYLEHRDIRHTVIYTAGNPERFERLWR